MYESFWNYLYDDFGLTDDEIFDAFHTLCSDMGLYVHNELLIGSLAEPEDLPNPAPLHR